MITRELADEAAVLALGAELGTWRLGSELVFLHGTLGAGKTTLVRGYLRSLGYQGAVKSPTYTLLESYEFEALRVYHFDFYRIIDPGELGYIGIDELMAEQAVKLVEWPAMAGDKLPPADIEIRLKMAATGRCASIVDRRG